MRRLLCIFISCFCLVFPLLAQSNRLIKELESKRGALQKQITESETLLKTTKKTVRSQRSEERRVGKECRYRWTTIH